MALGLQASVLKLKNATKISIWFHHYSPPQAKYARMAQGYMTYPDSSDTVWESQAVDFRRQPQGLPTRLQLCHHLLLHYLLEVNCLDTCYPRLKGACKTISKYARGGEELLFSRKGWARPPTSAVDPEPSGGAAASAGGLASAVGTIWLCFPACSAIPDLCSQEAQEKSSSPPNYSLVNGR